MIALTLVNVLPVSAGALSFIFFVAFTPSVDLAGTLEAVDIGALPAVEGGLGAIAEISKYTVVKEV
jgi:hypothetical protein